MGHPNPATAWVGVALCCFFATACSQSDRVWEAEHHFAKSTITAQIQSETRPVLARYASARTRPVGPLTPPAGNQLSVRVPLPGGVSPSAALLVRPRLRQRNRWTRQPAVPAVLDADQMLNFTVSLPKKVAAKIVVDAEVFEAAPKGRILHRADPFLVPERAALEFGMGVLEAASQAGDVLFSVEICPEGNCFLAFEEVVPAGAAGWRDRRLSLRPYAGERVHFRFRARLADPTSKALSLPIFSDPRVFVSRPRAPKPPNVILISLDTLRAQQLPSYGYPRDTAPFLREKFEREGTKFDHLVAAAPLTVPAHMTLFTSLPPSVHGLRTNFGTHPLAESIPTLAELLRNAGFATGAVTENGALHARDGFSRGFGRYLENKTPQRAGDAPTTLAKARDFITAHQGQRYFLFVHTYQAHYPYHPPDRYTELLPDPDPVPGLPEDRQPAHYDREIRYLDDSLRSWFDDLDSAGQLNDTLVIVTADHGEEFLEHAQAGHGAALHREVLRVPLLFWGPGIPAGRSVDAPVAQADLLPTLLELLDVPPSPHATGRSLVRQIRDQTPLEAAPIYSEAWLGTAETANLAKLDIPQPTFAVQLGDRKLIRRTTDGGPEYQYFDLARDPEESLDRFREQAESASDLIRLADAYAARAHMETRRRAPAPAHPGLDPERVEMLRSLGYVEEPAPPEPGEPTR